MPQLLTRSAALSRQPRWPTSRRYGGRFPVGTLAGFTSVRWPTSARNGGRLRVGIPGRLQLEFAPTCPTPGSHSIPGSLLSSNQQPSFKAAGNGRATLDFGEQHDLGMSPSLTGSAALVMLPFAGCSEVLLCDPSHPYSSIAKSVVARAATGCLSASLV